MIDQILKKQGEVMISLLGRSVFPEEKLKAIIGKNKRDSIAYFRGYNACDGTKGVTEIAKIIGVSQPTLTPILQEWESLGIVYKIDTPSGRNYVGLYRLNLPRPPKEKQSNVVEQSEPSEEVENGN